jgi:2-amino-4-hydroxy-6-hydroxymethyldihydropteridine diphosphokinase
MRYFIGLGSNIAPRRHMAQMLRALLQVTPTIYVGRIVETAPVGVAGEPFLNAPVCLSSNLSPQALKAFFNATEARLGRDRADPNSKRKSRTADLDLLFGLEDGVRDVPAQLLPDEPYMRPMLLELLGYLGLATTAALPALPAGLSLGLDDLMIGAAPLRLTLETGRLVADPDWYWKE